MHISKHFCLMPCFLEKIEFFKERNIILVCILARSIPGFNKENSKCVKCMYIFVANQYRFHCRFMKYRSAGDIFREVMLLAMCCSVFAQWLCTVLAYI